MGRIRVLSDQLINRIAAGEVVERPASVVKELVENSLDAGALSIEITLLSGGKRLIRVDDDGSGMDRDDALLSLERHATSKLTDASDLSTISTLGFRGEAISSIASVSRFRLATARADGAGSEIEVHGGRIQSVSDAGLPRGTSIRVERLFFNVPARRKFLRSESTELSHVVKGVTRFTLANPAVRFRVEHSGRELLRTEPAGDLVERIRQVYGRDYADKLLPVHGEVEGIRVHGFAGRPVDALPRRDGQHLFVNGRSVSDRVLLHAVGSAYGNTMPRGRYPALFLFVDIDPTLVDVNVHPQKTEVRFRAAARVHDLARETLTAALSHESVVPDLSDLRPDSVPDAPARVREATLGYMARGATPLGMRPSADPSSGWRGAFPGTATGDAPRPPAAHEPPGLLGTIEQAQPAEETPRAVPLAQFKDSYIVAQDAEGLVLVDQHAAHERVLFERYLDQADRNEVEVQKLLFPLTFELSPQETLLLEQEQEEFRRLGFLVEPFGDRVVRLDGIPAHAGEVDPESLFREILGEAGRHRSVASDVAELRRRLVTSAACHAAIKVNHPLTPRAMQSLLNDLFAVDNPSTCPHGRPALFRLTLEEIERAFRRR